MPKPFKIKRHGQIGEAPGSITVSPDALPSRIFVFTVNPGHCQEEEANDLTGALQLIERQGGQTAWIQVKGLQNANLVREIGEHFQLSPLVLEDITDVTQRPKYEEYDNFLFAISRLVTFDNQLQAINGQFSMLVFSKLVITFQETYDEYFESLKKRLQISKTNIRNKDSGYLLYALHDTIYDRYFSVLDTLEEALANLEEAINKKPRRRNMYDAQRIKRLLILLHRVTGPERDKMNEILRSDSKLIDKQDKIFLRDAYDHCIDIIETIHSQKELSTTLTDIYLSTINNQMNDVMRILTIVSAIFIPLSFIAGLYGMNFARIDPSTGRVMPGNMPELYNPNGYKYTLMVMAAITIVQLLIFWRKGWFNRLR